ncbi:GTP cyclohydrolase I [Planctomycetales bacterium 10988]|nr:GTP cyclohydrolase I [Planctomycetales bacterium 10988]
MSVPTRTESGLQDTQASQDHRQVAIDKVGVRQVTYPVRLKTRDGGEQHTVANINMYVGLPHHLKGTHMSRFLEVLNEQTKELTPTEIASICEVIRDRLNAEDAHLEMSFTYFVEKKAPVTGLAGFMNYEVEMKASCGKETQDFTMSVRVPATSLCPCSKNISSFGAHNQRCEITAEVRFDGELWIEDLIELMESSASSQLYSVLKRPDEKYVTEEAYENPKFVEDIIRDLALRLEGEDRITWYAIQSENFESIHNHNAYAMIEKDKRS